MADKPKTTAEMIALVRRRKLSEDELAELVGEWSQQFRRQSAVVDRDYEAAEFLHEQQIFGHDARGVQSGLRDYFKLRITKRAVSKLTGLTIPATAEAIRQIRATQRTRYAEWVN